jgi:chorismate mutase/prephenate dehydratase
MSSSPSKPPSTSRDRATIRADIDRTDDEILRLLNQRATQVAELAELTDRMHIPLYVPSREREIIDRLTTANAGPFPTESIRIVFQEIFSACLTVDKTMRVAYLGPEGTFSHMAVRRQFGLSARATPISTIPGVFEAVERGNADIGVVPVENTTEGVMNHTLDSFRDSELKISAEIAFEVTMCLLVRAGTELTQIERVYSIPIAAAQVRQWLAANLPRAALIESRSTAEGARQAHDDANGAAVASEMAAKLYDLQVLRRNIQDLSHNMTRFLVLGRQQVEPTGRDKTSVLLVTRDEPGILFRTLGVFAQHGINITKIESRPSRRRPWEYVFFLDLDGHQSDGPVAAALGDVKSNCESLKVLGSYPKAEGS